MTEKPVNNVSASVRQRLMNLRQAGREDYNALLAGFSQFLISSDQSPAPLGLNRRVLFYSFAITVSDGQRQHCPRVATLGQFLIPRRRSPKPFGFSG